MNLTILFVNPFGVASDMLFNDCGGRWVEWAL